MEGKDITELVCWDGWTLGRQSWVRSCGSAVVLLNGVTLSQLLCHCMTIQTGDLDLDPTFDDLHVNDHVILDLPALSVVLLT